MAIDRTNYNLLQDDSGAAVPDGTVLSKNQIKIVILDPIDTLLGDWTAWTPTWTNVTLGNGTSSGKYMKVNKAVLYKATLTFGSTTSITGGVSVNYPVTALSSSMETGNGVVQDASAGFFYGIKAFLVSSTSQTLFCANGAAGGVLASITSTVPFTWAVSDGIYLEGFYEIP